MTTLGNKLVAPVDAGFVKLEYESRICKTGDEGYDAIVLLMRFESAACTTTLINVDMDGYWPCFGDGRFEWDGFGKPVLNTKLKTMGFSDELSASVVEHLFRKVWCEFDNSGRHHEPCDLYFSFLFHEADVNWGSA